MCLLHDPMCQCEGFEILLSPVILNYRSQAASHHLYTYITLQLHSVWYVDLVSKCDRIPALQADN